MDDMNNLDTPQSTPQTSPPPIPLQQKAKSRFMPMFMAVVLGAALAGGGVYAWYEYLMPKPPAEVQVVEKAPANFTYTPKTGNLSLKLSTKYLVSVLNDGEKDGVTSAKFMVGAQESNNVVISRDTGFVSVEAYQQATTAEAKAGELKTQYESEGFKNAKTETSAVDGKPGLLLTADAPDGMTGKVSVYVVQSGEFLYVITALPGTEEADLEAVIKGSSIKTE